MDSSPSLSHEGLRLANKAAGIEGTEILRPQ